MPLNVPTIEELRSQAPAGAVPQAPAMATQPGEVLLPGTIDAAGGIGPSTVVPQEDGTAYLVPGMGEDGRVLSTKEARVRLEQGGSHYGLFESPRRASEYQQAHTSEDARSRIRSALLLARGVSPEQVARDNQLARELGVSPMSIRYASEEAEDLSLAGQLEEFRGLQEFASRSPAHAAYVRGDFSALAAIEQFEKDEAARKLQTAKETGGMLEKGGWGGVLRAPNESSARTLEIRAQKSWLQSRQGELARQAADMYMAGDAAGAEGVRQKLDALNAEIASLNDELGVDDSWAARLGFGYAADQAFTSMPVGIRAATTGMGAYLATAGTAAFLGAGAGGVGALPAAAAAQPEAALAGAAAYKLSSFAGSYQLERNLALADMLTMKDEAGRQIPMDVAINAATLYGMVAAGVEMIGDAAFLKAIGAPSKAALAGSGALRERFKLAAVRVAQDPAYRQGLERFISAVGPKALQLGASAMRLAPRAGGLVKTAVAEGGEEIVQEGSNILAETGAKAQANGQGASFSTELGTPEQRERIAEAAKGGFFGGLWMSAGPVVLSGVAQAVQARDARAFADKAVQRHAVVEQAKLKQLDPQAMSELLQATAPETAQEVSVPMEQAVALFQQGVDVITPMGLSLEEAQKAAALGQALDVPLSDLHARLDQKQFSAVSEIFVRKGEAASAADVQTSDEDLARMFRQTLDSDERMDAARSAESWLSPEQRTAYGAEMERLRGEMREAIMASPNLKAQVEALAGVEPYLDAVMGQLRRVASMQARRTGQNPADIARQIALDHAERSRKMAGKPVEEAVESDIEDELAEPEAVQPAMAAQDAAPVQEEAQPEPVQEEAQAPEESQPVQQAQEPEAPAVPARRVTGLSSSLITSQGDEPVVYEVWELGDLVASHDPTAQFAKREDYPKGVQERQYHAKVAEQEKVRRNAAELNPMLLLTDNPDLSNGPSVVTSAGYVLGGNSRAMSLQLAYGTRPEKAQAYRQALMAKAPAFGLDPQAIASMNQPVLVRVLQGDMTPLEMAQASRRYNESKTQELAASDEGVSAAKDISEGTLKLFREAMKDYETVAEYLQSTTSSKFVERLVKDGVIRETSVSRLTDEDSGLLNEQGRSLVRSVLRGLVIDDADIVRDAPEAVLAKIDRIAPVLVSIKARGGDWARAAGVFKSAVDQINKWMARGSEQAPHRLKDISDAFSYQDLQDREQNKRSVQAVAMLLATATERELYARCATMDAEAENSAQRANAMAEILSADDRPKSPAGAFVRAFFKPVAIVDGEVQRIFNPDKSETDEALMWASENSGPRHSVEAAREQLRKTALARKASPEEKASGKALMEALAGRKGTVYAWGGPRERGLFGKAFRYRKDLGDVLWQRVDEDAGIRAVRQEYENTPEWMKAPNGKPTNLTEEQWLAVRTPEFIASFGNWERAANANIDVFADSYDSVRSALAPLVGVVIKNKNGFTAELSNKTVKKILSGKAVRKSIDLKCHFSAAVNIKQLFETAEEFEPEAGNKPNLKVMHRFYAPFFYKGKTYLAKISAKEYYDSTSNRLYTIEALDVEKPAGILTSEQSERVREERPLRATDENLARLQNEVNELAGKLDENGEPRAEFIPGPRALFQLAWHGSPFRFSRFTLDHVGQGEGSQAHGYGLYFAQDRAVATDYRSMADNGFTYRGRDINELYSRLEKQNEYDRLEVLESFMTELDTETMPWDDFDEEAARWFKTQILPKVRSKGKLYGVNVPENDVLMDEQKAFGEQPEAVREALLEAQKEHGVSLEGTGRDFYAGLAASLGSPQAASAWLNERGVKGIAYVGERDGRCFVVWDEDSVQILQTLYQEKQERHGRELAQAPDAFARGVVLNGRDSYFIELFKRADLSTLFHELAHTYFLSMERYVHDGMADAEMQGDYEKLCRWLGAAPGEALTDEQHERLARGWEAYLMEGQAPSVELEGVFARIRRWFLKIYREIAALGVELNDEVRGVFDRMIATQDEIEDAAARNGLVSLTTGELQAMGVAPVQMAYTRRVLEAAKEKAAERLQLKRDQERKSRLADYRVQAREELMKERVYQARAEMRKTPVDLEAVRALVGEEMASRLMKRQPAAFRKDGEDPGLFAMRQGYASAEEMLADMDRAGSLGEAVKARAAEMDAEFDRQFDGLSELLDTEEIAEHASLVGRHLAKIAGRAYVQQQAVKRVAMQEMQGMAMQKALRVGDFRASLRRALRDERRAVAGRRYAEALEANTKARLNLEMARISQELREGVQKAERAVRRFMGSKAVPDVPKYFLARLVRQHGFLSPDFAQALVDKYTDADIRAWQEKLEADGYTMLIDQNILAETTQWRDMTLEQWREFADAMRQVVVIERNQRQLLTSQGKKKLEDAANEIAQSLAAHSKAKANGRAVPDAVRALRKLHVEHMKVEQMCLLMDGGKMGPVWEYVYKPVSDAADAQAVQLRAVRDYMRKELFGMYSKKEFKALGKKAYVASVGRSMTFEERLCVALNLGNAVNAERIKAGFQWSDAQVSDVVSALTARDWAFVQKVWDYLETFREPAFKVHEEITGSRPSAVEAQAFEVQTADGQTLSLRGGYYPIRYDPVENSVQYERDQKAMDQELFGGRNYGAAQTKHGHLKERSSAGLGTPLLLNFTVLSDHLFNVVHDITHRKAVLDAAKIVRNKTVREAVETYAGREAYLELMPWLQDCANERQAPMSQVQKMASWARASGTIMQMGYKLTTIFMVPSGFTQSISELGWKWAHVGVWHVLKGLAGGRAGIRAMWELTKQKSPMMASRVEAFDRDIRDFSKRINAGPVSGWVERARNFAFTPMGYVQLCSVDMPTWWGAYEKGLHEHQGDEAKAAAYADSIVRLTQASGATKDLARVQRGSDVHRMLTMFYSYFNTLYNLGALHLRALREDHTPSGIFRAANAALLLWFLPSVMSELLAGRAPDDGEDDLEGCLKWAGKIWIQYPFQSVVGVRDIASYTFSEFDYELSPAQSAPASLVKFFRKLDKALEEEDPSLLVKPGAEALGYALKLPMKQPIITVENMWDYCTNPGSEFYLRDLAFTKPKSRRQ